ncbi:MAG TPA: 4-hydroxy-tetrahydrodipicolinate synthase [Spirochaetia bacterium]|nr:4-hydroxy-tetrahydrodipicolinate synthase [Spirochaetia bacterium]
MKLQGAYTAMVTPFTADGALDFQALDRLVDFQVREGIAGLVPMGTTGESPTLTHDEHNRVIELVIRKADGRVPVIAGTGSNSTAEAVRMTRLAKEHGADASLQVAPYYNKPSNEGFYRHFMEIADTCDLPLIIYNIPGRTGKNIENSVMLRLAQHPNIVGVKEASGNLPQIMDLIRRKPADFAVLSGDDILGLPIIASGGTGIISVASNLIPREMVELVRVLVEGDFVAARRLHYRLLPLFDALLTLETNPIPIKYAMHLKGHNEESYRLPLVPMEAPKKELLKGILRELQIL